jgi:4'-phosphopantetheinyl transferase EntD
MPQNIASALPGDLIRRLMPAAIAVVEGPIPDPGDPLWPEESDSVKDAVPKRVREFAAGRAFARRALLSLDVPPSPLPAKPDRSPRWPPGFAGSITHVSDYCAVAVAGMVDALAIGIDVEDWERFDPTLVAQVFSPDEMRMHFPGTAPQELRRCGALIFSAKEALYKCLSAVAAVRLSFRNCTIELEREADRFAMTVPAAAGIFAADRRIVGRFAFAGSLVGTAVILPPALRSAAE